MRRASLFALWCVGLFMLGSAHAAPGNEVKARALLKKCQRCHGERGVNIDITIPMLAGQYAEYLVKQIVDFQTQNRTDEDMSDIAQALTKAEDIREIAAYFAAQTPQAPIRRRIGSDDIGKKIFESGIPERGVDACAGCHGVDGRGDAKSGGLFPRLAGQHARYIVKQIRDFSNAKRNTDPTGIMANIGKLIQPSELDAVAEYIAGL